MSMVFIRLGRIDINQLEKLSVQMIKNMKIVFVFKENHFWTKQIIYGHFFKL